MGARPLRSSVRTVSVRRHQQGDMVAAGWILDSETHRNFAKKRRSLRTEIVRDREDQFVNARWYLFTREERLIGASVPIGDDSLQQTPRVVFAGEQTDLHAMRRLAMGR